MTAISPILVTGASGFIGCHVVRQLAAAGRSIRLLDVRIDNDWCRGHEIIEGSVADRDLVRHAIDGVGVVIHLAHIIDIDGERPFDSVSVNIAGTANIFEAARRAGCRRVVWGSSIMTYASRLDGGPAPESHTQAPTTFYGAGKLYLEHLAKSYRQLGLDTVALRLSTVFGPERYKLVRLPTWLLRSTRARWASGSIRVWSGPRPMGRWLAA